MRISFATFALLTGFLAMPADGASTVNVHVFDFGFSVNSPNDPLLDPIINVGDTIHWIWDAGFHSTTSAAGQLESWNSGDHFPAFSFDHTFTQVGVFNYYCDIHGFDAGGGEVSGMSDSVTVQRIPEPTGLAGAVMAGAAHFSRRRRLS